MKTYVEVEVRCTLDGQLVPLAIIWEDGRRFEVDKVIDARRKASLKAGGAGVRFECVVRGKIVFLFMEDIEFNRLPGARWFVE